VDVLGSVTVLLYQYSTTDFRTGTLSTSSVVLTP